MGSDSRVGEVLASKYRLEELLGSGGMGHVYRAVNQHVGRTVAIKVLRAEHAQNVAVVERFMREARAANLVRHTNVVDVLDIGKEDDGTPFIVQELLDGEDLAHLATRRGGKLPVEEVIDLLLPVVEAVAEAHARGVIHRDIKPENVFLAKSAHGPVPKLLDFGISKVSAPDLRATEVGMMMGTPAYMSPEQLQGAREADPRSDVWALGIMMFELIAGRLPFDMKDAPALFVAIATQDAPTLLDVGAEVTPVVSRLVERCLRRRPDERYPSAAELGRDLRNMLDGCELEATGKRSLPPAALAAAGLVPDLAIPRDRRLAHAATITQDGPAPPPKASKEPSTEVGVPELAPGKRETNNRETDLSALAAAAAVTPDVAPPAPPSLLPPPAPARAAPAPPPRSSERRLAVDGQLPGVGLAPGPGPVSAGRPVASSASPRPSARDLAADDGKSRVDLTPIIGIAVVGLVAILGTGLLMQLVHRPEGWPVASFAVGQQPGLALAIHGGLALIASGVGITYCRRGVRHWRGELSGGPPGAVINAVVAAGAFFSAIELFSAVY